MVHGAFLLSGDEVDKSESDVVNSLLEVLEGSGDRNTSKRNLGEERVGTKDNSEESLVDLNELTKGISDTSGITFSIERLESLNEVGVADEVGDNLSETGSDLGGSRDNTSRVAQLLSRVLKGL